MKGKPMMPQHSPAARICRDCDGFAAVVITTGSRHTDGTRVTLTVGCPACHGTGNAPAARFARVGR
ncbi:DnaJ-class molecular chaperone [Streptomyces luteogriseus]|nr:DnaJ-class molecular chaperone [Streptomyces luteogriseus]